jgi:F420-dependent oxidoreductase-like protein
MTQMSVPRIRFSVQTPLEGAPFEVLARHWQAAERLGYDCVWLDDHFYGVVTPPWDDALECWTLMAALARETSTLRFGTLVACNGYRHPSLVAKMASSLDHISNGRLEFGLGAGWYEQEFTAYGYEFPGIGARLQQLDEALQICKLMWTEEKATFHGKHFRVQEAWCNPKPVQKPHPPIMVGGGGEKVLLRIVAKHADRWNFGGTFDEFRTKLAVLESHCRAIGRDPATIEKSWFGNIVIEADEERLQRRLAKRAQRLGAAADQLQDRMIVGTPAAVIRRIQEFVAIGVTHFVAMFGRVDQLGSTELFGREVIPAFRR